MGRVLLTFLYAGVLFGQPVGSGTIQGAVRNQVTGKGIAGVHIVLYTRQAVRYETDTDAGGSFLVTGVLPGTYQARLEKNGFNGATDQGTAVIPSSAGAVHMNLTMSGSVRLRGRVVGSDRSLVRGVDVRLLSFSGSGVSSDGPEFEFKGVAPGYYTLVAVPGGGASKLAPTYYPSSVDPSGAVRIAVLGDGDVDGLEIRMLTADTFRVRGGILNEAGEPVQGARVSLLPMIRHNGRMTGGNSLSIYPAGETTGSPEQVALSRDGTFTFNNVRKGDWSITAVAGLGGDGSSIRSGSVRVGVDRGDIENVEIRLTAPFQATGSIEWEGSAPRAGMVLANSVTGQSILPLIVPPFNSDGTFKLMLQPGRFYFTPPDSPGFYAASMTLGSQDVLGLPVDVFTALPSIHVVMKQANGTIRGKAEPGTSFVALILAQSDRAGFGRQVFPSADGTFEMNGVAPGDYRIAAFAGPRSLDPAILEKARTQGTRVRVQDSIPAVVELRLLHWLE